jgi:hypothetical protein
MKNFRLAKIRNFPAQRTLENGSKVEVSEAWTIHLDGEGNIGCVLRTTWGDRCASYPYASGWAGSWHIGSKRECARYYVADYLWEKVASAIPSDAPFEDRWLARCAYLDGATVEQTVALARLGNAFVTQFFRGYKVCAAWSSHAPERAKAEFIDGTGARWSKAADAEAWRICRQFCMENAADLEEAVKRGRPVDHLGHDLWLTGAGHGAGFWDRNELEDGGLGERLTEACKQKPYRDRNISVYRGVIHFD